MLDRGQLLLPTVCGHASPSDGGRLVQKAAAQRRADQAHQFQLVLAQRVERPPARVSESLQGATEDVRSDAGILCGFGQCDGREPAESPEPEPLDEREREVTRRDGGADVLHRQAALLAGPCKMDQLYVGQAERRRAPVWRENSEVDHAPDLALRNAGPGRQLGGGELVHVSILRMDAVESGRAARPSGALQHREEGQLDPVGCPKPNVPVGPGRHDGLAQLLGAGRDEHLGGRRGVAYLQREPDAIR